MLTLQFLGAAGTVTGSKYLLTYEGKKLLIDCGLFQGQKDIRSRNWEDLPIDPAGVDALVLTHAHIDHTGFIPRFVRDGFKGPIYCTPATKDLCELLLPDSAHLQEEQAFYMNKEKLSKHHPALPLYTITDAQASLRRFTPRDYHAPFEPMPGITATYHDAGHILGSAWIELTIEGRKIVFSGDLGRKDAPILRDPEALVGCDYLICEATYGDRLHGEHAIQENLKNILWDTMKRFGVLVVPAFAVERSQEIVYLLSEIRREGELPEIPVYVDSPMATRATRVFARYPEYFDEAALKQLEELGQLPGLHLSETVEQSKAIARTRPPFVVISASGMATGGRILHHLKQYLPDARNTVLLVGFQSVGTRGWQIQQGQKQIKIFGEYIPVRARVEKLDGFSGHADYEQINEWLKAAPHPPRRIFLTHGEPGSLEAQRQRIAAWPGWDAYVPAHLEEVQLEVSRGPVV